MLMTCYTNQGILHHYQSGVELRAATDSEIAWSEEAAKHDGGAGVIEVDIPREMIFADERGDDER